MNEVGFLSSLLLFALGFQWVYCAVMGRIERGFHDGFGLIGD